MAQPSLNLGAPFASDASVLTPVSEKSPSDDGSVPSSRSPALIDPTAERRLVRKLDFRIYPILFVVYMLSFLDRINISNARIQGMTEELDIHHHQFNIALFVYFIPYILLELPSNMIIHKFRPSYYLASLMFCWGLVNMCMGFVESFSSLVALRFLLGVFEAGLMPGIVYLTSMYYKRHEFQTRMSLFFCSTLIGGAFGGLLAYSISKLGGSLGLSAWRWIFIIEGAATSFVAIFAAFLIVDWPEQCRFLNPSELMLLKARLADDGGVEARMDTLNAFAYNLILKDWKIWTGSILYMGVGITGYSVTFFLPSILLEFGWTAERAQVYTIPVYAASAVVMILVAKASDHYRHRYGFILGSTLLSTIGYAMLLSQGAANLSPEAKYGAVFLVAMGGYAGLPICIAWLSNNVSGRWKRAFSSGIQITIGNIAGILASNIFLTEEAPTYRTGYGTALGMVWVGCLAATALFVGLLRENRLREQGRRDSRLERPEEEVKNMGDWHPSFRFTL